MARWDTLNWIREQALKDPKIFASLVGLSEEDQLAALSKIAHEAGERFKSAESLVRISALQAIAAEGKLPEAIEFCENLLTTGENLIVFANRRSILNQLSAKFGVEALTGDTPAGKRTQMVAAFQGGHRKHPERGNIFLANLKAGGVGITLTAASHVAILEPSWSAGTLDQAEDRAHRIGQRNAVNIYYLVGKGSIDTHILQVARGKRETALETLA